MASTNPNSQPSPRGPSKAVAIAAVIGLAAFGAIYAMKRAPGNGPAPTGTASTTPPPQAESAHPSVRAAFIRKPQPEALPNVTFQKAGGEAVTLDAFKGRVVLLNLWATWCIPCRKEMPALDRLQAALGSPEFEVVALSVDRAGAAAAEKFLKTAGVSKLALYVDPTAKLASEFKAIGLPTSILIGRDGREIGRLLGPAEWDGADAVALVRGVMGAN